MREAVEQVFHVFQVFHSVPPVPLCSILFHSFHVAMTDDLSLTELTRALEASGLRLGVREGRLKIGGSRKALTPALMQAIRDQSAALLRKAMAEQYAPLLLDLWQGDVIGPLACWLWFEVDNLPMDRWITTGLYADRALYRRIKEGVEAGPGFRNKAHLRGALLALYDHVQRGKLRGSRTAYAVRPDRARAEPQPSLERSPVRLG